MSKTLRGSAFDQRAVSGYDELVVLGIVIILFSAGIAVSIQMYGACQRNFELNELYYQADEISDQLRNHKRLIHQGQSGVFEVNRILELEDKDLMFLVIIPDGHRLSVFIRDLSLPKETCLISLNWDNARQAGEGNTGRVVIENPVNLYINELEVHAAQLTVTLRN